MTYTRDEGRSEGRDCSMAKNFRELEAKMSLEGRARSDAKTQKMIEERPTPLIVRKFPRRRPPVKGDDKEPR